jgi:hypothetical protein
MGLNNIRVHRLKLYLLMNQTKVEKDFDCLKFKEQAQEKIAADIRSSNPRGRN